MIFNPYDIHFVEGAASAASSLSWAQLRLEDNAVLVVLILLFLSIDILACRDKSVMRHQLAWITDTRNARTFESVVVIYPWLKPLMLLQMFLFFGLTLFCLTDNAPAEHLFAITSPTLVQIGLCMSLLPIWYVLQGVRIRCARSPGDAPLHRADCRMDTITNSTCFAFRGLHFVTIFLYF